MQSVMVKLAHLCTSIFAPNSYSPIVTHSPHRTGCMDIHVPPAPGQRCRGPSAAWLFESSGWAYSAGLASAPRRNHHLPPRWSRRLSSVHCTYEERGARAASCSAEPARTTYSSGPSRFFVSQLAFRLRRITFASLLHRGAADAQSRRVDGCRDAEWPLGYTPCLLEPYRPRIWSGQCRFGAPECVRWLCGTDLESPSTIRDGTRSASKGAHTEHCRSGMRPLAAKPCLPEPGWTTYWSVPCRFAAGKSVRRLYHTMCPIGAIPPVCPYAGGARQALRRPPA